MGTGGTAVAVAGGRMRHRGAVAASGGSGSSLCSSVPPAPERTSPAGGGAEPGMEFPGELGKSRGGAERRAGDLGRVGVPAAAAPGNLRCDAVRCGPAGREAADHRRADAMRSLEIHVR